MLESEGDTSSDHIESVFFSGLEGEGRLIYSRFKVSISIHLMITSRAPLVHCSA